jgi:hypothetical protein
MQQVLPFRHPFGEASLLAEDGYVLLYGCDDIPRGQPMAGPGPCFIARAPSDRGSDSTAYEFWVGGGWSHDERTAQPVALPPGPQGGSANPPGGFSVVRDPTLARYLMVYSPWPALTEVLELRVADDPLGPWSAPAQVHLPGCGDPTGGQILRCYAASAQPIFSEAGRIGLGYYDRAVATEPRRGSYLITTVGLGPSEPR